MKKNCKRTSEKKNNQTQLKTTGRNVEGEEKNNRQASEKYEKRSALVAKDTLDEKGQARDTSTHVTFNALNSTKNSPVAAG